MLLPVLCVAAVVIALYIVMHSFLLRRRLYDRKDAVKRMVHNAHQDAMAAANFSTDKLGLSLMYITSAISKLETVMGMETVRGASELAEADLYKMMQNMRTMQERIMNHMHELYPRIAPRNPMDAVPIKNPDLSYYNPNEHDERPYEPYPDDDYFHNSAYSEQHPEQQPHPANGQTRTQQRHKAHAREN